MTRVYTRSEVIDYFTKAMPWPTPEELAPIVIYIKHATGCPASEGNECQRRKKIGPMGGVKLDHLARCRIRRCGLSR